MHLRISRIVQRLVVLDYIIHNTDRGADNYMIKFCDAEHEKKPLVDVAPSRSSTLQMPLMGELRRDGPVSTPPMTVPPMSNGASPQVQAPAGSSPPYMPRLGRTASDRSQLPPYTRFPHIHIAAIDNSLAFPHEHPRGWRS